MPYTPARPDGTNATQNAPADVAIGETVPIPARQGRAVRMAKGQSLTIINPHGHQVCDFWALIDGAPAEFLSMEHTRTALGRIYVRTGDVLVTNRRRPLIEIVEDTSPGVHDTVIACCDAQRYEQLGAAEYHDNCADNFRMSLAVLGVTPTHVPGPFNIWMNIPVAADGGYTWEAPVSKPGDHITLRAHADCICVMSACPQDMTPVNGIGVMPCELAFRLERFRG